MKYRNLLFLIIMFSIFHLEAVQDVPIRIVDALSVQKKIASTCLVYIAADNSLQDFAPYDLFEMMGVGSSDYLNILVYLHTKENNGDKVTKRLFVQKGHCVQDGNIHWQDSGKAETLYHALEWSATKFPSDQFVLILWNHGSGELNRSSDFFKHSFWWVPTNYKKIYETFSLTEKQLINTRGVCYDDTTGSYLTDRDLNTVLSSFIKEYLNGKKIDIIGFDACLMADCEIAHSLQLVAKYLIASQETIPGQGFGYTSMFNTACQGSVNNETFIKNFLDAYDKEYAKNNDDYTLSAIDLEKYPLLFTALNQLSGTLIAALSTDDYKLIAQIIERARHQSSLFEEPTYIDLMIFINKLLNQLNRTAFSNSILKKQLIDSINQTIQAINQTVIGKVGSAKFNKVGGLSLYFDPQLIDESYTQILWADSSDWLKFLKQFLGTNLN